MDSEQRLRDLEIGHAELRSAVTEIKDNTRQIADYMGVVSAAMTKQTELEAKHNAIHEGVVNAHARLDKVEGQLSVGEPYLKVIQWMTEKAGTVLFLAFVVGIMSAIGWKVS